MPHHTRVGGRAWALGREDTQDAPGPERALPRLGHGACGGKGSRVHLRAALEPGEEDVRGREARHLTQEPGGRLAHGQDADSEAAGRGGRCGEKSGHAGAARGLGEAGGPAEGRCPPPPRLRVEGGGATVLGGGCACGGPSLPVSWTPERASPCCPGATDATWDGLSGRLSAQAMLVPEAHRDTGKDRRLLRLWEPLTCSSRGPSSTAPLGGAPATTQDTRASCRSPPTARQVKVASPWSHGPRRGGCSR